ncbi:glycine zipper domain-containing protein [Desulfatirhabdium butyrativorans]|uniref:glycine zipper domain-containing protein n=1 Tax=Desulfatirhabdium butyrativorans TaxID=340467 RepID=UPI0004845B77|nr:glycine zipper domain-containing protein [Desulfatirhabdium butyrativorans]
MIGAGAGAIIGSFILPGIGTVIGAAFGGWVGSLFGPTLDEMKVDAIKSLCSSFDDYWGRSIRHVIEGQIDSALRRQIQNGKDRIHRYVSRYAATVNELIEKQAAQAAELALQKQRMDDLSA